MEMTILMLVLTFGLPILIIVGLVFLQLYLSKKESKWLGLILPLISFLYSLVMVLSIAAVNKSALEIFGMIASVLFISNIPTIIFMAIYLAQRQKIKTKSQIDKMNLQDL